MIGVKNFANGNKQKKKVKKVETFNKSVSHTPRTRRAAATCVKM